LSNFEANAENEIDSVLSVLRYSPKNRDSKYGLNVNNLLTHLDKICLEDRDCKELNCKCDESCPYRSIDGSCNNCENTWWGKANTVYSRLAKPDYDDKVQCPRTTAKDGSPLPNERLVSLKLTKSFDTDAKTTILSLSHGQFLTHDVSELLDYRRSTECSCNSKDSECFSIPSVPGDYINYDQKCMSMSRSAGVSKEFHLNHREQVNGASHYIDLSVVYGSDERTASLLRKYEGGLLKTSKVASSCHEQLAKRNNTKCPYSYDRTEKCFLAGDPRAEDNVMLLSLHALWLREHNRIARKLAKINPYWCDETLYQEARRITIAEFQHINSNEYWPAILGDDLTSELGLTPTKKGYFNDYNKKIFPGTINEFATAAFRVYHTVVNDKHSVATPNYKSYDYKNVSYYQFNTVRYAIDAPLEDVLHGITTESTYYKNVQMNRDLKNYLFQNVIYNPYTKRYDLFAINTHRGRDHGFPGYNQYREICGLNRAYNFDDLRSNIQDNIIHRLKEIYNHVEDIDLYAGIVAENPFNGHSNGYTSACINALQFKLLKHGDRFWYENGHDKNTRFTLDQLEEIKQVTMARVICDNTKIDHIQKNPFLMPDPECNPYVDCKSLPRLNLMPWNDVSSYGKSNY